MMRNIICLALTMGLISMIACTGTQKTAVTQPETVSSSEEFIAEALFGEEITTENAITYQDLLGQLPANDSLATKVKGTVAEVCQAKGCWMTIVQKDAPSMMVKFKDYGFFVPKDISGRQIVMEGYAFKEVTPIDELRHYAEDAGKSKEEIAAITEPKEELKFLASGVALLKE